MKLHLTGLGLPTRLFTMVANVCVLGLALIGGVIPLRATIVPPTDNTAAPYLGNFNEGLSFTGMAHQDRMLAWLYRSQMFVHTGCGYANWFAIEGESGELNAMKAWLVNNPGGTINYMLCMLPGYQYTPQAGTSMNDGAQGHYDIHFTRLANALVSRGLANNMIIRIGHEFNGNWYPWGCTSTQASADYVAYWQHIVTAMRAVPGAENLKFEWGGMVLAVPYTGFTLDAAYPGDSYVDYIGTDIYDVCGITGCYPYGTGYTDAQRQSNAWYYLSGTGNFGLTAWKNYAAAHHKPLTIPEWGLCGVVKLNDGGLDDPNFILRMYNFIQDPANNVYYSCYFDVNAPDGHHLLTPLPQGPATDFPNGAARFRQLFGIAPLPLNADIGTVGLTGTGGVVSVTGAGTGFLVGATSDNFHFNSKAISGDDSLTLEIPSMSTDPAAQSGIMLRKDTTVNAAYAALLISNGNCIFQSRTSSGAAAVQNNSVSGVTTPIWLKLVRQGTGVVGYKSTDGLNWTFVGGQTVSLPTAANLGVAVASGNPTTLNTTAIDQVNRLELNTAVTGSITGAIVMDNAAATGVTIGGTWTATASTTDNQGADYLSDGNVNKGASSVKFTPTIPTTGQYEVYMHWPAYYKYANNTPVTVTTPSGTDTLLANQEVGSYLWNDVGTYTFNAGATGSVTVSNTGTTATVVADSVMYVPVPQATLPIFTMFKDPTNAISFTAQYGTITGTIVGTDAGNVPYEGATQYKLAYTSGSVGYKWAFANQNLTTATHLRIVQNGPLINSTHTIGIRLGAADGTMGGYYTLTRTTSNHVFDIPMSSLAPGVTLSQVNGIFVYPSAPTAGQSDTVYFDDIMFIKKY